MRDKGECAYGDRCKFSHDPKDVAQAKQKGRPDKRGKILCKYIKDPSLGDCPSGDKCPYNHDPDCNKKKDQQDVGSVSNRQDGDGSNVSWDKPVGLPGSGGLISVIDVSDKEHAGVCRAVENYLAGIRRVGGLRSVIVSDAEGSGSRDSHADDDGWEVPVGIPDTEACRAAEGRVLYRPSPQLSGWRAESSWTADPIVTEEVANGSAEIAALKAEVAQLKATLATSVEIEELKAEVAQLNGALATLAVALSGRVSIAVKEALEEAPPQRCELGLEPAALADPHEGDPRWSLHSKWLQKRSKAMLFGKQPAPEVMSVSDMAQKQCTAVSQGSAGVVNGHVAQKQCTAVSQGSAGIVSNHKEDCSTAEERAGDSGQTCEECTGEPAISIAKSESSQCHEPGLEPAVHAIVAQPSVELATATGIQVDSTIEEDAQAPDVLAFQSEWAVNLSRTTRRRLRKKERLAKDGATSRPVVIGELEEA